MTDTDDTTARDDWVEEFIDRLLDTAIDFYSEDPANAPVFKAAEAAFDDVLDEVDYSCIACVRRVVGALALNYARLVNHAARADMELEELDRDLAAQAAQRWLDQLAVPVPVSDGQLELPTGENPT
ncbi:MAG TPA: hypothetical protein VMS84_17555 [Mycobacterium sp.]|jgi:hypothetical protein|nr:hypothetical protein [Mycobacterium sp.]